MLPMPPTLPGLDALEAQLAPFEAAYHELSALSRAVSEVRLVRTVAELHRPRRPTDVDRLIRRARAVALRSVR